MKRRNKVSVCIASFNGAKYIRKQLQSILEQLGPTDEVIISDDSSTDSTIDIIEGFNDKRIRLFRNMEFRDPCKNFENALKQATGDIIFLSDQDDVWLPNKVELMCKALHTATMVICDAKIVDEDDVVIADSYFKIRNSKPGLLRNIARNGMIGCCMAFKRQLLNIALPFPDNIGFHDYWLGFVASLFGKVYFLHQPLTLYRNHGENTSSASSNRTSNGIFTILSYRLKLVSNIPKLIWRRLHIEVR